MILRNIDLDELMSMLEDLYDKGYRKLAIEIFDEHSLRMMAYARDKSQDITGESDEDDEDEGLDLSGTNLTELI